MVRGHGAVIFQTVQRRAWIAIPFSGSKVNGIESSGIFSRVGHTILIFVAQLSLYGTIMITLANIVTPFLIGHPRTSVAPFVYVKDQSSFGDATMPRYGQYWTRLCGGLGEPFLLHD
jgi:hypothetical protein